MKSRRVVAILVAGGVGARLKTRTHKVFVQLAGRPMLFWAVRAFEKAGKVDGIILVVHPADRKAAVRWVRSIRFSKVIAVVPGGKTRMESVSNGLMALPMETEWVLVHDAARPLVTPTIIEGTLRVARKAKAAIAAVPVVPTIKEAANGSVVRTLNRNRLWAVQTPQVFERRLLDRAHAQGRKRRFAATDDAALVERLGQKVSVVMGSDGNIKVTTPEDLVIAEALLKNQMRSDSLGSDPQGSDPKRIGFGFDIHRLVKGRPLLLGGVKIPSPKGLQGHSDADVLLHAICDALLGAAGAGDMGAYFPDTDPKWKGTPSRQFVEKGLELVSCRGLAVANLDLVVMAETPRLAPHREKIRQNIARILGVQPDQVNLKAKTMEGLGEIGAGRAVAAYAAVLLGEKG